jgi:hypothetical protein
MAQKRCDNTEDFKDGKFQWLKNAIFMKNPYILIPGSLDFIAFRPYFPGKLIILSL